MKKYSQIIYLDPNLTEETRKIQNRITEETGSRACVDIWAPHISIGDGILLSDDQLEEYKTIVNGIVANQKPFNVTIKDFGYMDNRPGGSMPGYTPNVIYLNVVVNDTIKELAQAFKDQIYEKYKAMDQIFYTAKWPYNPHLTVAYKDLDAAGLEKMKEIFSNETFNAETTINHVAIAEEMPDGSWPEVRRSEFKG